MMSSLLFSDVPFRETVGKVSQVDKICALVPETENEL